MPQQRALEWLWLPSLVTRAVYIHLLVLRFAIGANSVEGKAHGELIFGILARDKQHATAERKLLISMQGESVFLYAVRSILFEYICSQAKNKDPRS